jgi:hypothetical protein
MDRVESEYDFLARMVPHHEEAVDAAAQLLEGTQREQLRTFARDVSATQTSEIEQMQLWLEQWYPDRDIRASHEPVMRDLSDLRGDDLDRAFLEDISISTVKAHLAALVRKLGAGTASSSPSGPTRPAASRTDLELAALEHTTWIVPGCNAVSSSRARPSSYVGRHLEFGTQPTNHGRSTQASTRSRCVPP